MARLSERNALSDHIHVGVVREQTITATLTKTEGETNMSTTLRTINLTLVDNNSNLKAGEKIVFQQLNYITEHNDDQSIQQILMTGDVAKSLINHNKMRSNIVDKDILRSTGRDVMLEDVEIFDLDWMVVRVA